MANGYGMTTYISVVNADDLNECIAAASFETAQIKPESPDKPILIICSDDRGGTRQLVKSLQIDKYGNTVTVITEIPNASVNTMIATIEVAVPSTVAVYQYDKFSCLKGDYTYVMSKKISADLIKGSADVSSAGKIKSDKAINTAEYDDYEGKLVITYGFRDSTPVRLSGVFTTGSTLGGDVSTVEVLNKPPTSVDASSENRVYTFNEGDDKASCVLSDIDPPVGEQITVYYYTVRSTQESCYYWQEEQIQLSCRYDENKYSATYTHPSYNLYIYFTRDPSTEGWGEPTYSQEFVDTLDPPTLAESPKASLSQLLIPLPDIPIVSYSVPIYEYSATPCIGNDEAISWVLLPTVSLYRETPQSVEEMFTAVYRNNSISGVQVVYEYNCNTQTWSENLSKRRGLLDAPPASLPITNRFYSLSNELDTQCPDPCENYTAPAELYAIAYNVESASDSCYWKEDTRYRLVGSYTYKSGEYYYTSYQVIGQDRVEFFAHIVYDCITGEKSGYLNMVDGAGQDSGDRAAIELVIGTLPPCRDYLESLVPLLLLPTA